MENKIKVKPEGREGVYLVEKDDLKKWIKKQKFKRIHNSVASGSMIIGADHDVESVFIDIDNAERQAILVGKAQRQNIGHALALILNNKLEMYDIGEIKMEDLEIYEK